MTFFDGAPTVIRNYGRDAVLVARYENGGWNVTSITELGDYLSGMQPFEKALFAAPAMETPALRGSGSHINHLRSGGEDFTAAAGEPELLVSTLRTRPASLSFHLSPLA